jgi:hypothetical protein
VRNVCILNVMMLLSSVILIQSNRNVRLLEQWDLGFISHYRHECMSAFLVCLCSPVQVASLQGTDPRPKSPINSL